MSNKDKNVREDVMDLVARLSKTFLELVALGDRANRQAGELLDEVVQLGPAAVAEFKRLTNPDEDMWTRMLAVGQGRLNSRCIFWSNVLVNKMLLMTPKQQTAALAHGIRVLDEREPDETLQLFVQDMTPRQRHVVFSHSAVRTIAQQRAWIACSMQRARHAHGRHIANDIVIRNGELIVYAPSPLGNRVAVAVLDLDQVDGYRDIMIAEAKAKKKKHK